MRYNEAPFTQNIQLVVLACAHSIQTHDHDGTK